MSNLSTEFKVGLFTLFGSALLTTTAVTLGGNPFAAKKQHFYTILKNAGGVAERTQVRVAGVQVGEVKAVELLPDGAKVAYDIDSNIKIPKGSFIEIKARGILGDVFIEVTRNEAGQGFLENGSALPLSPESNDIQTLITTLNSVARDIKKVSNSFANVLGTEQGETSLKNIVGNIEGITADLREVTSSQKTNLKEAIQAIRDSAVRISALLERNDAKIDAIIANMKEFTQTLRDLATPENKEKIDAIIANVNDSAATLKRLMTKVENGEGTIGQLLTKNETADEVKATLKSIQDVVKPISQLKLTMMDRGEYRLHNARDGDRFSNEFNIAFSTRPDRYYLLGVTNSAYARKVTKTTTTTVVDENGRTTTRQEDIPEDVGLFRYNLQIAQRFGFVAVRLGLFASSGGVATDWYAFNDRVVGTVEMSQFGGSPVPSDTHYGTRGPFNLKAFANVFITPNLFITGGVDGMVINDNPFPFIGAGISISDDDIKGLFGVAALAK